MNEQIINEYKAYLNGKRELLDATIMQLKKEFVGIHNVIDQIAEAMGGWYFFLPDRLSS